MNKNNKAKDEIIKIIKKMIKKLCRDSTILISTFIVIIVCLLFKSSIESEISNIKAKVDLKNTPVDNGALEIAYYRELSDKTFGAINIILTTVGICAAFISVGGYILAFKVPREIEKKAKNAEDMAITSLFNFQDTVSAQYGLERVNNTTAISNAKNKIRRLEESMKYDEKSGERAEPHMMVAGLYGRLAAEWQKIGKIWQDKSNYEEYIKKAIYHYEYAISLITEDGSSHYRKISTSDCYHNLGLLYYNLGLLNNEYADLKKALNFYDQAVEIYSENVIYFINRGFCKGALIAYSNDNESLEKFKVSMKDFEEALKLDSMESFAHYGKSVTFRKMYEKTRNEEYHESERKSLDEAKMIDPNYLPVINRISELNIEKFRLYQHGGSSGKKFFC